jgi:hypothetical protein
MRLRDAGKDSNDERSTAGKELREGSFPFLNS